MKSQKLAVEKCECANCNCGSSKNYGNGGGGAIYGVGIFGAAFYYFPQAVDLTGYALALIKSLGWPAILVYQALSLLNL